MLPIVEKYFILTKKFRDQYGKNTVIFIQEGDSYKVFGYYLHDEQIKVCENIIHLHVKKEDSLFTSEFYYNMHKYYEKTILSNDVPRRVRIGRRVAATIAIGASG